MKPKAKYRKVLFESRVSKPLRFIQSYFKNNYSVLLFLISFFERGWRRSRIHPYRKLCRQDDLESVLTSSVRESRKGALPL
ncbi:hypothetical protein CCACVL1_21615 [Corchorus capsularis]|uniref:Uncharacterized protein n=1 Tax=Corchorus capsularis TaxID=210143 RepID=A0A1R3H383_COCAP|nr:hypothetical protein CCACVL1_21615 [Corchorus capsularis]